ncbi:MAG: hypothetical protein IKI41_05985 [Clostridia bacterium]|nr:hypothetical protein [Clostridia bacterium]
MRRGDQELAVPHEHDELVRIPVFSVVVLERLGGVREDFFELRDALFAAGARLDKRFFEIFARFQGDVVPVRPRDDGSEKVLLVDKRGVRTEPGEKVPYEARLLLCADVAQLVKRRLKLESAANEACRDASGQVVLFKDDGFEARRGQL